MALQASKWRFYEDRLLGYLSNGSELHYVEICGPSSVSKPTVTENGDSIGYGSIATETDTGKVYFYDETSGWVEQFSFQS